MSAAQTVMIDKLQDQLRAYEEAAESHRALVRRLDVALNGDGAAKQASLCDIVGQVECWRREAKHLTGSQSLWSAIYNRRAERSA